MNVLLNHLFTPLQSKSVCVNGFCMRPKVSVLCSDVSMFALVVSFLLRRTPHAADMSFNSSSTSSERPHYYCSNSELRLFISIGMITAKTLFLPLSAFILFQGYRRWRRQRSFKTTSHSDFFTYHLAVMEMFWGLGFICYLCGTNNDYVELMTVGLCALSLTFYGELSFHILACVERYLAVVHPIIYMQLRNDRGMRIRNFTISCVWLLCFGLISFCVDLSGHYTFISMLCSLVFSIIVVSFCSLSVLHGLIRPGPGEGREEKQRVDPLKHRAFVTITAISSVLWVWFVGVLVAIALSHSPVLSDSIGCVVMASVGWFNLPTSLMSPLLYLHRKGKLSCCYNKPE